MGGGKCKNNDEEHDQEEAETQDKFFFSPPQGDTERRKTKIYREYGIYGECGKYFYLGGSGAKRGTSCYKVN